MTFPKRPMDYMAFALAACLAVSPLAEAAAQDQSRKTGVGEAGGGEEGLLTGIDLTLGGFAIGAALAGAAGVLVALGFDKDPGLTPATPAPASPSSPSSPSSPGS